MKKQIKTITSDTLTANQKKFLAFDLSSLPDSPDIPPWEDVRQQILSKLTDEQLAAILSVSDLNLATLFWNLYWYWYERWDEEQRLEWPQSLHVYLRELALAIPKPDSVCQGRLTESWFKPRLAVLEEISYWAGQYRESLLADEDFKKDFADIQKDWPPGLDSFLNIDLPQWLVPVLNPASVAETYLDETSPSMHEGFSADYFRDAESFAKKLMNPTDPVSLYISDRLSVFTREALRRVPVSGPVDLQTLMLLTYDLNMMLQRELIYEKERFAGVTLRPETQRLLAQNVQRDDWVSLNRFLLEDAYPSELSRKQKIPNPKCSGTFLRKARQFVRRWNLEEVLIQAGELKVVPAKIRCASHVNSQGTYLFIPRYYKWTDIRNYGEPNKKFSLRLQDFRHVLDLIEKTYARFESVGNVKGRKAAALIEYVKKRLGNQKPTSYLVLKFADDWIAQKHYKGHSDKTKYRNVARNAFHLPKPPSIFH